MHVHLYEQNQQAGLKRTIPLNLEISSKNITINHIDQGFEPVDTKETQATDPSKRIPDAHSDDRWVILLDLHQRGFPEIHVINIFWHSKVLYNGATCPAPFTVANVRPLA